MIENKEDDREWEIYNIYMNMKLQAMLDMDTDFFVFKKHYIRQEKLKALSIKNKKI